MSSSSPLTVFGVTLRNLWRQPVRTLLTVLGVGLGVVAIVALSTMMRGLTESLATAIKAGESDMMVYQSGVAADIFSVLDEEQTRAALLGNRDVAAVSAGLFHVMPAANQPFVLLFGVNRDEYLLDSGRAVAGRKPNDPNEIMLGTIAAQRMELGVGESLSLSGETFHIVGIYETDVVFFNGGVVMLMPALQELIGREGQCSTFMLRVRDGADPVKVGRQIEADHPNLVTITSVSEYSKVDRGIEIGNAMVYVVSLLAIIIGGIIVMNTMWMSVYERTREIGVLRTLGWSRSRVLQLVLTEAAAVGVLACGVGCVLGVALAELTTVLPVAANFQRPVYDWPVFAFALAVAVVLSVLGALAPAWRATQIQPVEALRYE